MKKFSILIMYLFGFLAIMPACKKTLDERPRTFISPEAFFTSPESYDLTVKGIYQTIPVTLGSNAMLVRETFSDIIAPPHPGYEQGLSTYQNNHQPFYYNVRDLWSSNYTIVKNANFTIQQLERATILSDAAKNALLGEAHFLRAFAYFNLVQLFGDVPLPTTPLADFSNVQIARSPQAEVYELIVQDLLFAETSMAENAVEQGRVYKAVATALLAKVYLTMAGHPLKQTQYYQQAKDKALAVINSGKFTLRNDYAEVFHNAVYTSESIWEQLFELGNGGNSLHQMSATVSGYVPILLPAGWFINSFPPGDRRRSWGIQDHYVTPAGISLDPFFYKYVNDQYIDATASVSNRSNYTIPILRLAEMYLIAAEAENEVNGPANAYQYINEIRRRARIDKNNAAHVPDLASLSQEQFREAVWMERKWELHLEGSTWYDLKRTNTLNRIQTIRGAGLTHPIGAYNDTWYIPDNEITNNNIPQNPAYQ